MPFGFCIDLRSKIVDYRKRVLKSNMVELKYIFIAIASPILNAIFVIIFGNCNFIVKEVKDILIYSNFFLFIFNLVPIYPLDGGRFLRGVLRIMIGKKFADESMNIIANFAIVILTIAGSIAILYFKNIAVLLILAYIWKLVFIENKRFKLIHKISTM